VGEEEERVVWERWMGEEEGVREALGGRKRIGRPMGWRDDGQDKRTQSRSRFSEPADPGLALASGCVCCVLLRGLGWCALAAGARCVVLAFPRAVRGPAATPP